MSCSSTDKNTQLLRQQITANYQALNAELTALEQQVSSLGELGLPALPSGNLFVGSAINVAAAKPITGDVLLDFNGVTSIASGAIVNDDISPTANIAPGKLALGAGKFLIGGTGSVAAEKDITGAIGISIEGVTSIATGVITNAQISTGAAIDPQKVALASGRILIGDVNSRASAQAVSGDVAITTNGTTVTTAITANSIVNADINSAAGITPGKLALGSEKVYIGSSGGVAAEQSVSALSALFGIRYVKTWAELQAAITAVGVAGGGVIYIDGVIEIPPFTGGDWTGGGWNIYTPNLVITGPENGKSVLKLQSGVQYNSYENFVININTSNVVIENITIQGVTNSWRFLTTGSFVPSTPVGIHIARGASTSGISNNLGVSNIIVRNVTFKELKYAVYSSGGTASGTVRNVSFLNNKVRACGGGYVLSWGIDELLIDGNSIIGDGAIFDKLKFSYYNPIWVGIGITNARIINNYCADHQRIGIEVFFPFSSVTSSGQQPHAVTYGQNGVNFIVANNTVKNVGSMGISFTGARNSVVANNTIIDCGDIGLEMVGDDENRNTQTPDRVVNVLCIGNTIKNVSGGARRPNPAAPTGSDYGYSAIPLNPNSTTVSNSFSNRVLLAGLNTFSTGDKVFTSSLPTATYPEFAVGKEVQLKIVPNADYIMTGTVVENTGTSITINIPVGGLNAAASATSFSWYLCPYGLHTLSIPSSQLEWSANEGKVNNIDVAGSEIGTFLAIQSAGGNGEREIYFTATLRSYVVGANTCSVYITGSGPGACNQKTNWIAYTRRPCMGMTIDQINGAKVIGNTIDTVLDSNSSERFGCQIIGAKNVIFENNLITRAGTRYLQVNNSNKLVLRNNVFRSGDTLMERDPVTQSIIKLGEDVDWPENAFVNNSVARPTGLYTVFSPTSIDYNATLPYNNCRIVVKDNTFIPSVNPIRPYVNGGAIFSDQFSRPETQFNGGIDFKHNTFTDGYDVTVDFPSPVLDYSQKWNNASATTPFIGYRFHADPAFSPASSRIFDIASGDETYLHLRTYTSFTSHSISTGPKTFTISNPPSSTVPPTYAYDNPSVDTFKLATIPAGTFVRCVSGTLTTGLNFVEGRVTTAVSPSPTSTSFTMEVTNTGGSGTGLTSWKIIFDTSVLFIDKTSNLNLRSDVVLDYHTGTKVGTAATQKLGFWGKTPVVQPVAIAAPTAGDLTSTQAKLNEVLAALRATGIIAT
jgi:hypothetical protein